MKTLIIVLILASFIQTTILPINLVLIVLVCRAYLKPEKQNLYLAFAFGLFTSHLNLVTLGLGSITYLLVVQLTQVLAKSRLAGNSLLIVPITFVLLSLTHIVNSLLTHSSINLLPVVFESIISLPIFFFLRLWEERFIIRKEIKLKV